MPTRLEEFAKQTQLLSLQERSALIDHLISRLDEFDENECERLWLDEATRRYQEYKAGKMSSRSAEEVFQDARVKLRALP
ncbi:MAG: addiction module antitoxin RelB [Deltaproteobacteria bacterium CG23_combo_of_CG06-09_8_20_14_all_51_20]|nr:MAG: addiction module antitoxin RelB [Deltaproteobacteria bacterium CG23_combo_of_CG06-09_8_20_14_all_51_20]